MTPAPSGELRRALARLDPADPVRPLVELVLEDDEPALTVAVARRLFSEIRAEKGGPSKGPEDYRGVRAPADAR